MIEVSDLSVSYPTVTGPVQALTNVSTKIERNEFVSIVGPSGCGKSTLMMCIAGLLKPSSGSIFIDGTRVQSPYTQIGVVFQEPLLLDWRTVL
jgi:NitT/TauT family transport system ATP-binding protein